MLALACVPFTSDATSPAMAGSVSHELPGRKGTLPARCNQLFRLMLDRRRNSRRKRIGAATSLNIEDHWAAKTRRPLHRSTGCRVLSEQQARKRAEDHC